MSRWQGTPGTCHGRFFRSGRHRTRIDRAGAEGRLFGDGRVHCAGVLVFLLLAGVALFVLRFREPTIARPFKVPLYPILPIIFIATCAYPFYSSVTYAQSKQAVSIALYVMLAGMLVWGLLRLTRKR